MTTMESFDPDESGTATGRALDRTGDPGALGRETRVVTPTVAGQPGAEVGN